MNTKKTRNMLSIFILLLIIIGNTIFVSSTSYSWNIKQGDEIKYNLLLEENDQVELQGETIIKIDSISTDEIDYSITCNFDIDRDDYKSLIEITNNNTNNGYIVNYFYYEFILIYAIEVFENMEENWKTQMEDLSDEFHELNQENNTITYSCTSNVKGFKIQFNDRKEEKIWSVEIKYSIDGILEHFVYISDDHENSTLWEAIREGFEVFGYYISGYSNLYISLSFLFTVFAVFSIIKFKQPKINSKLNRNGF